MSFLLWVRHDRQSPFGSCFRSISAILLLFAASQGQAQTIATDFCACTPSVYEFAVGFDRGGASIRFCISNLPGPIDGENLIVDSILISESNRLGRVLQRVSYSDFQEGDSLELTSVTASQPPVNFVNGIPTAIELQIVVEDIAGSRFVSIIVVDLSNDCDIYPVFEADLDFAGWMSFGTEERPLPELCPLAAPTFSPTVSPTLLPTNLPTRITTLSPTKAPVTEAPTTAPPTNMPTRAPSTEPPTLFPLTSAPTKGDFSMSMSMKLQRSLVEQELQDEFLVVEKQLEFGRPRSRFRRKRTTT